MLASHPMVRIGYTNSTRTWREDSSKAGKRESAVNSSFSVLARNDWRGCRSGETVRPLGSVAGYTRPHKSSVSHRAELPIHVLCPLTMALTTGQNLWPLEGAIMARASLVPSIDGDIHLVLCRFGRAGLAYVETDPAEADATTVVQNLLYGRYGAPLRVVVLNVEEGWSRDVSEVMADKVLQIARQDDVELTDGTLAFIDAHTASALQPTHPLW
jgi:hypothetical protein